jgi:SAM-dependent methyltransferase
MNRPLNDPIGQAILEYIKTGKNKDIIVKSELCDDDIIPSEYLFRTYDEMPKIEKIALSNCKGEIIDIGAGAGTHARYLTEKGHNVKCIDLSPGSIEHLKSIGMDADRTSLFELDKKKYDTVLMLMNGIGIAGTLSNLENTLLKVKTLLNKNGKLICDSCDIKYLYEDDEDGLWIDLNSEYHGNFKFQMKYGKHSSEWFDWLYVDYKKFKAIAEKVGFSITKLAEQDNQYLVELSLNQL